MFFAKAIIASLAAAGAVADSLPALQIKVP